MKMTRWKVKFTRLALLLFLVATTGLLASCGNSDNSGGGDDSPDTPSITQGESLPLGKPFAEGVYAGRVDDSDAFIAIVANDDTLKAYVCDDAEISEWFTGENTDRAKTLINKDDIILSLNKNGDNEIVGSVLLSDGIIRGFIATLSEDHLLVRGQNNNHSEFTAVAGWIKLADGAQRGAIRFKPRIKRKIPVRAFIRTQKAPRLKITNKKPVLKGIRARMKEKAATALNLDFTPIVTFPNTNPVQPKNPGTSSPNGLKFVWTTVGDSYGAGEGNPITDAALKPDSFEVDVPAVWGETQNLPPGVSLRDLNACHRSDEAGAPKANRELVRRFPDVTFEFASFACSGAKIRDLTLGGYLGVDKFEINRPQEPQLVVAAEFAALHDAYDVTFMNVGGNDAGFGEVIKCAITPFIECKLDAIDPSIQAIAGLGDQYKDLDDFIRTGINVSSVNGTPPLLPVPRRILLGQPPDPLINSDGTSCNFQAESPGNLNVRSGDILLEANINEINLIKTNILDPLQTAIDSTKALGWTVVDGHLTLFDRHGVCVTQPGNFINSNLDALDHQGDDLKDNPLPFAFSVGMMHPNDAGYEVMKTGILDKVQPLVQNKVDRHLLAPGRLRVLNVNAQGDIRIGWDDRSTIEDRYLVTVEILNRSDVPTRTHNLPIDVHQFDLDLATVTPTGLQEGTELVVKFQVRACRLDRCLSPLPLEVSNFKPAVPDVLGTEYTQQSGKPIGVINMLIFDWVFSQHTITHVVEYERTLDENGRRITPVGRPSGETTVGQSSFGIEIGPRNPIIGLPSNPFPQGTYKFRVAACNHAGCSDYSNSVLGQAVGGGGLGSRTAGIPDPDFILQVDGSQFPNPQRPSFPPDPGTGP